MAETPRPDEGAEIEGILSELDNILSGAGEAGLPLPPPATQPPIAGGARGTGPPSTPPPPEAKPPAAPPLPTPPPDPSKIVKLKVSGPPPPKAPGPELKIELPPRSGVLLPPDAKPPEKKPGAPAQTASAYRPPLEIKLDLPGAGVKPPPPATQPPRAGGGARPPDSTAPPPPPAPPPAPAPAPAPVPAREVPLKEDIPANTPMDQIRKVAFLHAAGQRAKFEEFVTFVDSMSLHFTKKPLYLRKVIVAEVGADTDLRGLLDRIRASGAVGVVGYLPGIDDARLRALEEGCLAASLFYRALPPEEAKKRSAIVDLLVELMLLSPG